MLESRITALELRISELENRTQRKFNRVYEVVYQILGRIYNQLTEIDYIYNYWNYMVFNKHHDTYMEPISTDELVVSDSDIDENTDDELNSV
jgi:hypothetical protein